MVAVSLRHSTERPAMAGACGSVPTKRGTIPSAAIRLPMSIKFPTPVI